MDAAFVGAGADADWDDLKKGVSVTLYPRM
jgi:hypothetical protein